MSSPVAHLKSMMKSEDITKEVVGEEFGDFWGELTRDAMTSSMKMLERDENIKAVVQETIKNLLGSEDNFYRQKQIDKNKDESQFMVKQKHMKSAMPVPSHGIQQLKKESDWIISQTSKYYDIAKYEKGKKFDKKDVEQLFHDVLELITTVQEKQQINITRKYKVDPLYHVEKQAVEGFTKLHKLYCDVSSPVAHLESMMKEYHDLFLTKMGQGDAAVSFCKSMITRIIVYNIDEYFRPTKLLDYIREWDDSDARDIFKDVKSLEASIMTDLVQKDKFEEYLQYITDHEKTMRSKLKRESVKYFTENDRLKNLAKRKLEEKIQKIYKALAKTSESKAKFVQAFLSSIKMSDLKIPQSGITTYLALDIKDPDQFTAILLQQLHNLRSQIIQSIDELDVTQKLSEKDFPKFVLGEIVGCRDTCPFCKATCDAHSAGKTQGRHSATMHRPLGLVGIYDLKTNKLLTSDCCYNVASNSTFTHGEDNTATPYLHFQRVYPDWNIDKKANPNMEKIWKWVLAKYSAEFASYYDAEEADVPEEWKNFQTEDVLQDFNNTYSATGIFNAVKKFLWHSFQPKVVTGRKQPRGKWLDFKF